MIPYPPTETVGYVHVNPTPYWYPVPKPRPNRALRRAQQAIDRQARRYGSKLKRDMLLACAERSIHKVRRYWPWELPGFTPCLVIYERKPTVPPLWRPALSYRQKRRDRLTRRRPAPDSCRPARGASWASR